MAWGLTHRQHKIESENLEWIRTNQQSIRADLYQGLGICPCMDRNTDVRQIGGRKALPSSSEGGPRKMANLFQVLCLERELYMQMRKHILTQQVVCSQFLVCTCSTKHIYSSMYACSMQWQLLNFWQTRHLLHRQDYRLRMHDQRMESVRW